MIDTCSNDSKTMIEAEPGGCLLFMLYTWKHTDITSHSIGGVQAWAQKNRGFGAPGVDKCL